MAPFQLLTPYQTDQLITALEALKAPENLQRGDVSFYQFIIDEKAIPYLEQHRDGVSQRMMEHLISEWENQARKAFKRRPQDVGKKENEAVREIANLAKTAILEAFIRCKDLKPEGMDPTQRLRRSGRPGFQGTCR